MKRIETIFTPDKLEPIEKALVSAGLSGLTVTDVVQFFRARKHGALFRNPESPSEALREVKLDLIVEDTQVEAAVTAIRGAYSADMTSKDSVFISSVLDAIRVRTGEHGAIAIQ